VVSVDLFYEPDGSRAHSHAGAAQSLAVEMEAAALFALGAASGIAVGCILVVSDVFEPDGTRVRIDEHALLEAAQRMGAAAVEALTG